MADDVPRGPGLITGGVPAQSATTPPSPAVSPASGATTPSNYMGSGLASAASFIDPALQAGQQAKDAFTQGNYGYALGRALAAGGLGIGGAVAAPIAAAAGGAKVAADAVGEGIGSVGRGLFGIQDQRLVPPTPPPVVGQVAAVQNAAVNNPAQAPAATPDLSHVTNVNDPAYKAFAATQPQYTPVKAGDKHDFMVRMPNDQGDAMEKHLNSIPIGLLPQYLQGQHLQQQDQSASMLQQQIIADNARAQQLYEAGKMSFDQLQSAKTKNYEALRGPGLPYGNASVGN